AGNITESIRSHMIVEDGISYIQVHPTFLYESLWNIAVLVLIIVFMKKRKFDGEIFLIYLVGYGLGRLWIEGLRTDQLLIPGTSVAVSQVLSGVLVIAGIIYWVYRRRTLRREKYQDTSSS
ncbi:MAG: prolipoprotein diacylglyceryl transferase, partial [Lachnospiraceae bacterium]|nr:prolipoprotein diacylglyceryl transferase [Lachnospiraceae bacterium]